MKDSIYSLLLAVLVGVIVAIITALLPLKEFIAGGFTGIAIVTTFDIRKEYLRNKKENLK